MDRIRIGVVGPGLIWKRSHKPALDLYGDQVEITAYSASSEKSRREVQQTCPDVPFYGDYHDLAAAPEVDWVLVLTPIALNAPVAEAAMRAGKHVFMEKPMARSLAEAQQLVDTANETGRSLLVLEQAVYGSHVEQVERVIRSGEIGDLVVYDQVSHHGHGASEVPRPGSYAATAWRIHPDFPLGTLFDGGHHPMSRLTRLFGRPATVYARGRQLQPTYGEFDHVLMAFGYDSGVCGSFSFSSFLGGQGNTFRIWGTEGVLIVEREQLVVERLDGASRTIEVPRENDHVAMWRALLGAVAAGREPYYTKERALQELEIMFAIHRSTQENEIVRL